MADYNPSPSAPGQQFPEWQPQFQAAFLEVEPEQLQQLVISAEEAIFRRMQALVDTPNGHAERQTMEDAVRALRVIQVEKLNYPKWNSEKKYSEKK